MPETPLVYTVIAAYNSSQWIQKCLGELERSSVPTEIVVVDNASEDDTVSIINRDFESVHLIESKQNLGFGKANNLGIEYALRQGAEYILLLNHDAWTKADTIEALIESLQRHPDAMIVSPVHQNSETGKLERGFNSHLSETNRSRLAAGEDVEEPFINAAIWLLPRASFEQIGGFNPLFPHYGEDLEYCNRVLFHGYRIFICGKAEAFHERNRGKRPRAGEIDFPAALGYVMNLREHMDANAYDNYLTMLRKGALKSLLQLDLEEWKVLRGIVSKLKDMKDDVLMARKTALAEGGFPFLKNIKAK